MKKKLLLLAAAVLLLAAAIVGGSLAATSAAGQKATSDLAAPKLQASIGQSSSSQLSVQAEGSLMPGDQLDNAGFTIENTAEVPLYARVTVSKYWADDASAKNNQTKDAALIEMRADTNGWLQAADVLLGSSEESEVYYYALPLQPGESAPLNLSLLLSSELGNDYQGASIVLNATVDAVQYVEGQNELNASGILATFGVAATLNGDGSLAAVAQ